MSYHSPRHERINRLDQQESRLYLPEQSRVNSRAHRETSFWTPQGAGLLRLLSIIWVHTEACRRSRQVPPQRGGKGLLGWGHTRRAGRGPPRGFPHQPRAPLWGEAESAAEFFPSVNWVGRGLGFRLSLWRNRLARSAVNRKVGGSSPPRDGA